MDGNGKGWACGKAWGPGVGLHRHRMTKLRFTGGNIRVVGIRKSERGVGVYTYGSCFVTVGVSDTNQVVFSQDLSKVLSCCLRRYSGD